MVMSEHSAVVGVFTDYEQAEQAINELRRVGFSDDEISVSKLGDATGGFMAGLRRLFKGQETTPVATADDFMRMGVPEQDANYYQNELDAGRTIVLVRVAGQQHEVLEILRKNGALTSRPPNSNAQAETDHPTVAPDMSDPIANREVDNYKMTSEDPR